MSQPDMREVALRTLKRSRSDPVWFVRHVLKAEPTPQQIQLLQAVAVPGAHVAVKSGHGTGKSSVLSWLILWFLLTHKDARVPCTAPSAHQLSDVLWSEVARWINGMHELFRHHVLWSSEAIRIKGAEQTQFAVARTARPEKPEALQGFHAPHLLFVIDEASGVPDAVFEVAQGALTSPNSRVVMTSNPTMLTGYFYEAFHRQRDSWTRLTFSAEDSPIVAPEYCREMADKYGRDSDIYKVRVLGEFPSASVMQLIPLPVVQDALGRHLRLDQYGHMPVILGCDVSYYGDDKSVVYLRQGLRSTELWSGYDVDTVTFAGIIGRLWREHKADACFVDVTGWGAGVVDTLRSLGFSPQPVAFGSGAGDGNRFVNRRVEMWWSLKEWLEGGGALPDDSEIRDDLIGPQYFYTPGGKIALERKEDMKKRGLHSPDKADALALTFAEPVEIRSAPRGIGGGGAKVKYDVLNRRR